MGALAEVTHTITGGASSVPDIPHWRRAYIKDSDVRRYAEHSTSPYIGFPVEQGRHPAIFERAILRVALACPKVTKVRYDHEEKVLVLYGKGVEYRLVDRGTKLQSWTLKETLMRWAMSQTKRRKSKRLTASAPKRYQCRIIDAQNKIELLKKNLARHYVHCPSTMPNDEYHRKEWEQFVAERPIRKALAKLAGRWINGGMRWKEYYAAIEAATGLHVNSICRHDKVCNRKGGPSRIEFVKWAYKFAFPCKKHPSWGWDDTDRGDKLAANRYRKARIDYLEAKRGRDAITLEVANWEGMIHLWQNGENAGPETVGEIVEL